MLHPSALRSDCTRPTGRPGKGALLEHPDKATAFGNRACARVDHSNSREAMARATDEVFRRVLSGS